MRLRGHLPNDTLYQSLSPRWWENVTFSIFLYDDPNLPPSPSVPADSNGAKEKAAFPGSHFVHQQYSILPKRGRREEGGGGGGGMGFLFTVASSILMVYPSAAGLAATTVSALVAGCEEAACYLLFADRYTQRRGGSGRKHEGPFIVGAATVRERFLGFQKMDTPSPLPLYQGCTILTTLIHPAPAATRADGRRNFHALVIPLNTKNCKKTSSLDRGFQGPSATGEETFFNHTMTQH